MHRDRFTRFAWSVLWYTLVVILWGAFVRASGSGAGCGSHWPLCNGEVLPRAESLETAIELTHRVMSGLLGPLVVAMAVWCFRLVPRRHPARTAAVLSVVLTLAEGAIGAGLVLLELVDENDSLERAGWMAGHLGNTLLLLAALVLTAHWGGPRYRPPEGAAPTLRWTGPGRPRALIAVALAGTMVVGITGAVTALGDTLLSSSAAAGQSLSPTTSLLKELRLLHPLIAVVVSLFLLQLIHAVRRRRLGADARRWANGLNLLVFGQLTIGAVNVALAAPVWLQLGHLLLADLLWILLILTCAAILESPAGPAAGG